jgi:hypothetical protein
MILLPARHSTGGSDHPNSALNKTISTTNDKVKYTYYHSTSGAMNATLLVTPALLIIVFPSDTKKHRDCCCGCCFSIVAEPCE